MAIRTYCMLIDIKRDIFEIIKLKPIDTGNKLHIKFSEDGKPVNLTGQTVKFMAKKPDGTGVYNFAKIIDAKAGEIEVEITNQMTAVDGELDCEIEIEGAELITTMTFYITVDRKINDGEFIESTNEFTVLQKAIRDAYEAIELMETKTDTKLEQLQSQVDTAISDMNETTDTKLEQVQAQVDTAIRDMNTTTDNKLSQVQSQVNTAISNMNKTTDNKLAQVQTQVDTAISNMNSTTNNKLAQLQSQVNIAIEEMNETTDTKLADLQQQVTTAISNMNSKTDTKLSQVQSQVDNKLTAIQGQVDTLGSTLTKKVNDKITEVTNTQTTLTNKVDAKIADIQGQFDTLETELIDIVDDKITEVENTQSTLVSKVDSKIAEVTATQNTLTSKVDAKIVELTNAVNAKITEHTNTINTKVTEVNNKLKTVDTKIAEVNSTVSNANSTVNTLKQDVATAIAGIDTKIATSLEGKADKNHNHDTLYLGKTAKAESAKSADAVAWDNVTGKPSTFTPATHNHDSSYLKLTGGTVTGTINAINLQVGGANVYTTSRKPTPADIGASASNHTHTTLLATGLSGQTVSLDTFNLASGTPQVAHYYCPTDGGGSNITGRPNDGTKNAFSLKVELIRWASTTDYITKQTYIRGNEKIIYIRYCTNGTWSAWEKVYTSSNKPTPADIGASASNHNHDSVYLGKTAKATSASVADSANSVAWDNVTGKPSSFAPTSHNHDSSYLKLTGGTVSGTINATNLQVGGANVYTTSRKPTPADIGASASNHTHSYLALSGGTMTGKITNSFSTNTYLAGNQGNALINSSTTAGAYVMLYRYPSTNGYFTMGGYQGTYLLQYTAKSTVDAGTNSVTKSVTLLDESGNSRFAGTVTAGAFSGNLSGNATTATTLQTARTINGTSFNGSANITTANWGTARTITIGNTAKSVNGSGNVSWSLSEIGASASNHTHSYLPLSGGTLTGKLTLPLTGGALSGSGITTGNTQLIGTSADTIYLGNPKTKVILESISNPTVSVNGTSYSIYHTGNKPTPATIGAMADGGTYGTIKLSNWIRTTGNTGWYNETYGGGWYMTDSTWIRAFNNKALALTNELNMSYGTPNIVMSSTDNSAQGKGSRIRFNSADSQNVQIRHEWYDSPLQPFGLVIEKASGNTQNYNAALKVEGAIVCGANTSAGNIDNSNKADARLVRGATDNAGGLKVQMGGTNTTASFEVVNPNWSTAWFSCGNTGIRSNSYSNFSDKTLKTNIEETGKISDKINKIGVYTYNYLSDFDTEATTFNGQAMLAENMPEKRWGVIAQEIEKLFPELIIEAETLVDGENKLVKSVDVYGLTVLTLEYAKELEAENLELKLALAEMSEEKDEEILNLKLALAELVEGGL